MEYCAALPQLRLLLSCCCCCRYRLWDNYADCYAATAAFASGAATAAVLLLSLLLFALVIAALSHIPAVGRVVMVTLQDVLVVHARVMLPSVSQLGRLPSPCFLVCLFAGCLLTICFVRPLFGDHLSVYLLFATCLLTVCLFTVGLITSNTNNSRTRTQEGGDMMMEGEERKKVKDV